MGPWCGDWTTRTTVLGSIHKLRHAARGGEGVRSIVTKCDVREGGG